MVPCEMKAAFSSRNGCFHSQLHRNGLVFFSSLEDQRSESSGIWNTTPPQLNLVPGFQLSSFVPDRFIRFCLSLEFGFIPFIFKGSFFFWIFVPQVSHHAQKRLHVLQG